MSPLLNYERIVARLRVLRRHLTVLKLGAGALAALAYLAAAFLVAASVSLTGFAPVGIRAGWWVLVLGGMALILGPITWKYLLFPPSAEKLALVVESSHPQLKNRLIASLQLRPYLTLNREGYSSGLIHQTVEQADRLSENIDMAACVDRTPVKAWVQRTGMLIGLVAVMVVLFPGAARRALSSFAQPLTPLKEPVSYRLAVYPGDAEVVKFDTLAVRAVVAGSNLPARITFSHQAEGGTWISEELAGLGFASPSSLVGPDSVVFAWRLGPLIRDVAYRFSTPDVVSPTYAVKAVDRPRVTGIRLTYFFPAYTGVEPAVVDENEGAINALAGTEVEITVRANKTLASAGLVFDDRTVVEMKVQDQSARGRITVARNATYHFRLVDIHKYENPHPIEYAITRLEDAYPRVEILLPGHDADLNDNMAVNLKVAAVDDYGFSQMTLIYRWLSNGQLREEKRLGLPLPTQRSSAVDVDYWWDLEPIGMMPSDVVSYHVEATDNDRVSGPKSLVSKTFALRLPSLDEMIAEADQRQEENILDLEEVQRGERKLAEELEQLHREMLKADQVDWQTQKEAQALNQRQEELAQKLGDVAQEFSQNAADAEEKRLASAEMIAKLMEARQLFEEVATEEMKENARQLAEALQNLDPNEMAKALEKMELSAQEMIERLDRTIAYLKKLRAEQQVDQMVRRAEGLLAQQEKLNEETSAKAEQELPGLGENQDALKKDFDKFAEDLAGAEQSLKDANLAPAPLIEEFCRSAAQCSAPKSMSNAAQSMRQPNKPGAQKSGKDAAQALQEMVARMQNYQQMMTADMRAEIEAMLRKALEKALYLSEHQEDLLSSSGQLDPKSPALRDLAEQQADLKAGTQRLGAALKEIAKKSMCMGGKTGGGTEGVEQSMGSAMDQLSEQNGNGARAAQQDALFGLNQTAQSLLQGMQNNSSGQCQNPGSCSKPGQGMMPQMEPLSNRQGRLNAQMSQMAENMGNSMSNEERMALQRLKSEQEAIRKGVEELRPAGQEQRNLLGRLDQLSGEMKKVVQDMEQYQVSNQTLDRMQRVYARMLDFQHSLHRQDYKEERRARAGEDLLRASPEGLTPDAGTPTGELSRLLDRYLEEGYPKAYETLIKSYYRELLEEQRLPAAPVE